MKQENRSQNYDRSQIYTMLICIIWSNELILLASIGFPGNLKENYLTPIINV